MMRLFLRETLSAVLFCVVCVAQAGDNAWIEVRGGNWRPPAAAMEGLKGGIEGFVRDQTALNGPRLHQWSQYVFQYQGFEMTYSRYIVVNALCAAAAGMLSDSQMVSAPQLGSCFFTLKYDPDKKQFFDFAISGRA